MGRRSPSSRASRPHAHGLWPNSMSTRGAPDGRTEDGLAGSVATLTPKLSARPLMLTGGELPQAEGVALHLIACRGEVARSVPGNEARSAITLHPRE